MGCPLSPLSAWREAPPSEACPEPRLSEPLRSTRARYLTRRRAPPHGGMRWGAEAQLRAAAAGRLRAEPPRRLLRQMVQPRLGLARLRPRVVLAGTHRPRRGGFWGGPRTAEPSLHPLLLCCPTHDDDDDDIAIAVLT